MPVAQILPRCIFQRIGVEPVFEEFEAREYILRRAFLSEPLIRALYRHDRRMRVRMVIRGDRFIPFGEPAVERRDR